MSVRRLTSEEVEQMMAEAFARRRPENLDEVCDIAAGISMVADDGPWTDEHILGASAAMATGLFGPAFEVADYGQKTAWIDACERALRRAIP